MTEVKRDIYLGQIRPLIGKPFIKIISGLRRSGKSTILRLLRQELLSLADADHIVYLNLEDFEFTAGFTAESLNVLVPGGALRMKSPITSCLMKYRLCANGSG